MTRRALALVMAGALLFSGCWSRREINDLGAVISLGIDRTEDGKLEVIMSVVQPGASPSGKGQQQQTGRRSRVILRREGTTIAEALRLADLSSPRRLALDHTQIIVFGERFAREGVDALLDYLLRSPQVRLSNRVMMVRGASPMELLQNDPLMRSTQAEALRELESSRAGLMVSLKDFFIARATPHISPMVTVLHMRPHPSTEAGAPDREIELGGASVFKGDREALVLDRSQVRAVMWLWSEVRDAVITAPCPQGFAGALSIRVNRADRKFEPRWDGRRLSYHVTMTGEVRIADMQCHITLDSQSKMDAIQGVVTKQVEERLYDVIKALQTHEVDPIGFGERVRAKLPAVWTKIGGSEGWLKYWASVPVTVRAKLKIVHVNMTSEPPVIKRPTGEP